MVREARTPIWAAAPNHQLPVSSFGPSSASTCPQGSQKQGGDSHIPSHKLQDFTAIFLHGSILEKLGYFSPLEGFLSPSAASFQALLSREQCRCTHSTAWQGDARAAHHSSFPNAYRTFAGSSRCRKQPLRGPKTAQPHAQGCCQQGWVSGSWHPLHTAQEKASAAHFIITTGKQRKGSMESAHRITRSSSGAISTLSAELFLPRRAPLCTLLLVRRAPQGSTWALSLRSGQQVHGGNYLSPSESNPPC